MARIGERCCAVCWCVRACAEYCIVWFCCRNEIKLAKTHVPTHVRVTGVRDRLRVHARCEIIRIQWKRTEWGQTQTTYASIRIRVLIRVNIQKFGYLNDT